MRSICLVALLAAVAVGAGPDELHEAVKNGDIGRLKVLLEGGVKFALPEGKTFSFAVFDLTPKDALDVAVKSVTQIRQGVEAMPGSDIRLEFSPEEFTDTDLDFALEVCEAVYATWGRATSEKPLMESAMMPAGLISFGVQKKSNQPSSRFTICLPSGGWSGKRVSRRVPAPRRRP